jgi:hypothetical protein
MVNMLHSSEEACEGPIRTQTRVMTRDISGGIIYYISLCTVLIIVVVLADEMTIINK